MLVSYYILRNEGEYIIIPIIEKISPPIVPTAKANQKTSFWPPIIKGIKPRIVENIVSNTGKILLLYAFK